MKKVDIGFYVAALVVITGICVAIVCVPQIVVIGAVAVIFAFCFNKVVNKLLDDLL